MLNVVMLNIVMLNVVILNVVALLIWTLCKLRGEKCYVNTAGVEKMNNI